MLDCPQHRLCRLRPKLKLRRLKRKLKSRHELWHRHKRKLKHTNGHILLLNGIGDYRRRAMAHVSATLQTLQGMSEDMEDLRQRVAAPDLVGDKIPVEVHLKSIRMGLERLQADRDRTKAREEETLRRILGIEDHDTIEG